MTEDQTARKAGESGEAWAARMRLMVFDDLRHIEAQVYALRSGSLAAGTWCGLVTEHQVRAQLSSAIETLERLRSTEWLPLATALANTEGTRRRV